MKPELLPEDRIEIGEDTPPLPDDLAALTDVDVGVLAASYVSALSEDCWCAGWLSGAGAETYRFSLTDGPQDWGMGRVSTEQCRDLARLRERLAPRWVEWADTETDEGVCLVDAASL